MIRTAPKGNSCSTNTARGTTRELDSTAITRPETIALKMSAFIPLILAGNYIGDNTIHRFNVLQLLQMPFQVLICPGLRRCQAIVC
jgi:hypothetical protein